MVETGSKVEMNFTSMIKKPSAFMPMVMSLAALATVLIHITLYGIAREGDEGSAAHIFQLLITAQVPIVAFYLFKWLPNHPRLALEVLALQVVAVLAAFAPVFYFNL